MVGRIHFISPREMERFSMGLLLLNTSGARSFSNLRTVDGNELNTFHAAAIHKGLLHDDKFWNDTLKESSLSILDTEKIR